MKLDQTTGSVFLDELNCTIHKGMKLDELKETAFYKANFSSFRDVKTGYFWYGFNHFVWEGYHVYFNLCFFGDSLESMYLGTWEPTDTTSWDDWTEKSEMKVFERNNAFMRKLSGEKGNKSKDPYPRWNDIYEWGTLWSVYDPRSASSISGLSYNK
ncbi:hypothetical protein LNQ81_17875 [Myroides sp. M-43]|uniref:hypothetical protein n=1 Tax=Myroides oncorhynchi TaxID=2893756 RepID=UPI001E62B10C|nr:hypothetical protein [Myroides oncorhynchi]MCC9044541.1 hypothetical protein [Myroides oncorhynchi]